MNSAFKRKLTALLLVIAMLLSLSPIAAFADDAAAASPEQINVTVSFQDSWFILAPQTLSVSSDTAESYGFNLDEQSEHVTTLDVLVAANEAYAELMGGNFTKAAAETKDGQTTYSNELLTVQTSSYGAYIKQLFGNATSNCGFTVNGATPHDNVGKDIPGMEGKQYTGFAVNQAIVQNNDNVEFFIYQDDYTYDYYAFFTDEDDNRLTTVTAAPNEKIVLHLQGYPIAWYGCSTDEVIAKYTEDLTEFQLTLVDETATPLDGELAENISAITTQEDGYCEVSFPENGTYYLTVTPLDSNADPIIYPWLEINVGAFEKASIPEYKNEVYEDFQNDLWLQYDFKELAVGESATIYPRRVPQIVESDIAQALESDRPNFNFNIISGDSVVLNTNDNQIEATVTAVKAGDTLVMVSYDETKAYDTDYAACSEVNYAYVVFSVNDENTPDIKISTNIPYSSYDTLYYTEGDGYDLDFTVTADDAAKVIVTVNGEEITSDAKDIYHALLTNRSNIIGITAYDENNNSRSFYQVIDARKIEITAVNGLNPVRPLTAGEPVNISFKGITMPVYKLSKIYNPTFYNPTWGSKGTYVHYTDAESAELKGYCKQWDLADNNTITFTPKLGGKYTLTDGQIFSSWWGSGLYADKGEYKPEWVGDAPISEGEFSVLPDITLDIAYASDAVRVEGISLNQTSAALKKGETLQLVATITPENAENKNVTWTLTNTATNDVESYYATIDQTGKITALNPTPSGTKLIAAATTADGNKTAACQFTVKGSSASSQKDKINISVDTYTANNQSIIDLTAINYQDGDTAWSATKRLFDEKGISYTYNPKKNGYVSEINGVSEFDYGKQSGWMYSVNGEYPEIGCGAYELKAGDTIRWRYTLDLGKDLGVTIPNTDKPSGGGGAPETTPETQTEPKSDETNTVSAVPSFYDVAKNAWYYNPVTAIAQKGLMTGTAANVFEPNKATTRAELVAILYRMEGSPAVYAASTFSDVAPNAWYAAPITWAENAKVVAGLDRTHFVPDNALTREQVAAILYNYAKAKGLDITQGGMAVREYADYDSISSYALPSVAWAVNTGIISGKSGYVLDPQGTATRAEIAAMLERFIAFYKIS